ncbi:hypothetical protein MVG78_11600 [Roseomonas gilardii subsp. gilardii]|uniref:hypothetical protein n=1 Tax=Roseomonas gilardii TaxID=257708 RepID=UPI001FFABA6D|nr:hypothetical protein [Roseomonas gilardii]UPG71240.1 hypothetical protein MVG78_11600 [Roseomonas gilardii subsp. gilardii]
MGVLMGGLLSLGACVGSPGEGPFDFVREIRGNGLNGREAPPGLDQGFPNLASIPPRPARGEASVREQLTTALAANRAAAAQPIAPGAPVPEPPPSPGADQVPHSPPPPPRLASAPAIGPSTPTSTLRTGAPDPGSAPPAAPPPEMLAPPPPSLAPAPPAPPPADLLAPSTTPKPANP